MHRHPLNPHRLLTCSVAIVSILLVPGVGVTRRIFIDKENNCVRYVDLIKNTQPQDVTVQVQIQSNFNFGVEQPQTINDPRKKDNVIAWSATGNGRAVLEMLAGKGAKL